MEELWAEQIQLRHAILKNSQWYLIEKTWFERWWDYSESFDPWDDPGPITNDLLLDDDEHLIMTSDWYQDCYGKLLKPHLVENNDFYVVSPAVWHYLWSIYSGEPILRFSVRNGSQYDIEVHLLQLRIVDIPEEHKDQDFYEIIQLSKFTTIWEFKALMAPKRKTTERNMWIWKISEPWDVKKFISEIVWEFF